MTAYRSRRAFLLALTVFLLMAAAGCNGGSGNFSGSPPPGSIGFAYVVSTDTGTVIRYQVDLQTGALTMLGETTVGVAVRSQDLVANSTGRFLFVLNKMTSNVSVFTIDSSTGALTQITGSPFATGPSPNSLTLHPQGTFLYVTNGGNDTISVFSVNATTGALTSITGSPFGAGGMLPSGVTVSPDGTFLFVANSTSNNVSVFSFDATTGALLPVVNSPFAAGNQPLTPVVDPTGNFLYVTNFSSNDVSVFTITRTTGVLSAVVGSPYAAGTGPRSLTFSGNSLLYVANDTSANISGYVVNANGTLTPLGGAPLNNVDMPRDIAATRAGNFVYLPSAAGTVRGFSVNSTSGALTALSGNPFTSRTGAVAIIVVQP